MLYPVELRGQFAAGLLKALYQDCSIFSNDYHVRTSKDILQLYIRKGTVVPSVLSLLRLAIVFVKDGLASVALLAEHMKVLLRQGFGGHLLLSLRSGDRVAKGWLAIRSLNRLVETCPPSLKLWRASFTLAALRRRMVEQIGIKPTTSSLNDALYQLSYCPMNLSELFEGGSDASKTKFCASLSR